MFVEENPLVVEENWPFKGPLYYMAVGPPKFSLDKPWTQPSQTTLLPQRKLLPQQATSFLLSAWLRPPGHLLSPARASTTPGCSSAVPVYGFASAQTVLWGFTAAD